MNFEKEVLNSDKKVLVDFFATWCGPCRMLSPIIEEIKEERKDIKVISIDVDQEVKLSQEYSIFTIPCLIVFENGKEVVRNSGFMSKEEVLKMLGEK